MVFSSSTFLFAFLPIVITVYYLLDCRFRNIWLLLASFVFYSWNEPRFLWILLISIGISYAGARGIDFFGNRNLKLKNAIMLITIILNIGILYYFKYFNFTLSILRDLLKVNISSNVVLPIGISFFTFQSMSYVIDVWRGKTPVQKNIVNYAMYVAMFPQLVAGPIVRYSDINTQIDSRKESFDGFVSGVSRFILGLFRKIIIADCLAKTADGIFNMNSNYRTMPLAWIGIIAYTLQIYYDFSGYSDMAIGLGKMLGFDFMENFNYPYISRSISEFWRRWHISLSSFFRDYVYIPLGGNRKKVYRNTAIVFLLTGIWHGANYTFIVWGIWHGCFVIIERLIRNNRKKISDNRSRKLRVLPYLYSLMIVMIGWVFFRSSDIQSAIIYLKTMFGVVRPDYIVFDISYFMKRDSYLIMILAVIWSTPLFRKLGEKWCMHVPETLVFICKYTCLIVMLGICAIRVAASTYSSFIYFQF